MGAACESADPVQLRGALNWVEHNVDDCSSMIEVQNAVALLKEVGADVQPTPVKTATSPRSVAATRPPVECKTKVNALRRTSLDNLPRLLIIHLKRWMIDYST